MGLRADIAEEPSTAAEWWLAGLLPRSTEALTPRNIDSVSAVDWFPELHPKARSNSERNVLIPALLDRLSVFG